MSSDARTLPLRRAPVRERRVGSLRRRSTGRAQAAERTGAGRLVCALALAAILLSSLFLVILVADRPSGLSPVTHNNFFPRWMAGPLGGLWPGLTRNGTTLRYLFTGPVAVMYVSYLLLLAYVRALPARWAVAAIVCAHVIYLLAPPLALTDVFNYVNYGRMEIVHHLNPYTTIPILEPHTDPSYSLSNWHQLLSPYGPLFTLFTFAVVPLGIAGSFWALKGILVLASLAMILLVWKCARLLGRDPVAAIVLVGLNPIVLVWGLGGDHNDFLVLMLIVLGFYLLLKANVAHGAAAAARAAGTAARKALPKLAPAGRSRAWLALAATDVAAGAAFVTAAAMKASAGVMIPVVLAGLARTPRRLPAVLVGMAAAGLLLAAVSLIAFGLHIPDLSTQSRLVTNISLPNLLGLALGSGGETTTLHFALSVVLIGSIGLCSVQAYRWRDSLTASGWANVALLVTLSWVLPWYVVWVLPLAALSASRRLRVAALGLGVYLIIAWAPASGLLWSAIGFHPEKTSLGRLHQRYVRELLN
jgi:alpha-1,6-mannosyltransferase